MNTLVELIASDLGLNPGNGDLYLFRSKRADRIKIVFWSEDGFWLCYKRLEKKKFKFPKKTDAVLELRDTQLRWLLSGLNFQKIKQIAPPDIWF